MTTIEITENERLLLIFALGHVHGCPALVSDQSAPPATAIELARRLINMNSRAPQSAASSPAVPASKPKPIPADAKELSITPFAITKAGTGDGDRERLLVQWKDHGQTKRASCWASSKEIWPRLLERIKQPLTVLVVEKGAFLNIVGVK